MKKVPAVGKLCQTGAAALEFALVMPIFVLVLYGLVTFGSAFYTQIALSRAASDGARSLSLSSSFANFDSVPTEVRESVGLEVINSLALSIIAPLGVGGGYEERQTWLQENTTLAVDNGSCGGGDTAQGQLRVRVQYPFSAVRILPPIRLPLIGSMDSWMPQVLTGCATAQL